jgi:hypothetical protein
MAICGACKQEMMDEKTISCIVEDIEYPDGVKMAQVPYTPDYGGPSQRCHDCNIKFGGVHHIGCDMERCPRCGRQLISCNSCGDEEEK